MDLSYPAKYHEVARYFDHYIGDLEQSPLLTDAQRLLFYALRQQADHGPCTSPQPSMWYITERHKHHAWKQLGRMSTFEAMVFFVQQFEKALWVLEHPDDDSATAEGSPKSVSIDWPARLRELDGEEPAEVAAVKSCKGDASPSDATDTRPVPAADVSPSTAPPPRTSPSPAPTCLSLDMMKGWDADIVAHSSLSLDNLHFLATELMRAREALRQARGPVEEAEHAVENYHGEELLNPPLPAAAHASSTSYSEPPLKPMWTVNGVAMRVPIIPPPVRFSAKSLTEAAVRPPCEKLAAKIPTPCHVATQPATRSSWFEW